MKKALYIIYIPLLLLEWIADMLVSIVKVVHNSIETLTLSVQTLIHEPSAEEPTTQTDKPGQTNGQPVPHDIAKPVRPTANDRRAVSRVRR